MPWRYGPLSDTVGQHQLPGMGREVVLAHHIGVGVAPEVVEYKDGQPPIDAQAKENADQPRSHRLLPLHLALRAPGLPVRRGCRHRPLLLAPLRLFDQAKLQPSKTWLICPSFCQIRNPGAFARAPNSTGSRSWRASLVAAGPDIFTSSVACLRKKGQVPACCG